MKMKYKSLRSLRNQNHEGHDSLFIFGFSENPNFPTITNIATSSCVKKRLLADTPMILIKDGGQM